MFLLRLHHLALRLRPLGSLCIPLALAGVALSVWALWGAGSTPPSLLSIGILLTTWALMLLSFIKLFQAIPAPVLPKDRFFERFKARCKLALYHLLALAVLVLGVVVLSLSLKLLSATP